MKKAIAIALIFVSIFCFSGCKTPPSEDNIKNAFIGTFEYNEVIYELSSTQPNQKFPGKLKVGATAFSYDGKEWDGTIWNGEKNHEFYDIHELTYDERNELENLDTNNKLKKYNKIYSVKISIDIKQVDYTDNPKKRPFQFYYADGDLLTENNNLSDRDTEFFLIKLKKVG